MLRIRDAYPGSKSWFTYPGSRGQKKKATDPGSGTLGIHNHNTAFRAVWRIRDVYPGSLILIFTYPGSQNSNKREGWKIFWVIPFYLATNFTKLNIILVLKSWRKKCGSIFKKLYNFLPKKFCHLALKHMSLGSGIRDPEKTYSWSRIQGSKRQRIPDPDPQHCISAVWGGTCCLFF